MLLVRALLEALLYLWRHRFQIVGGLFILIGFGFAALLAFGASSQNPPDGSQSALLVVMSGLFQVGGTALFGHSRPSQKTAITSVRHIRKARQNVIYAKQIAEVAADDGSAAATKAAVGQLSWRLDTIQQQLETNLEDWTLGHPTFIREKFLKEEENET